MLLLKFLMFKDIVILINVMVVFYCKKDVKSKDLGIHLAISLNGQGCYIRGLILLSFGDLLAIPFEYCYLKRLKI
jgi:hypothetical protein